MYIRVKRLSKKAKFKLGIDTDKDQRAKNHALDRSYFVCRDGMLGLGIRIAGS